MRYWGISWLIYSAMFLLDFLNLQTDVSNTFYLMIRQWIALAGCHVFFIGTHHFFQIKPPKYIFWSTIASGTLICLYDSTPFVYTMSLIPNIIYCSGLLIFSGCMFISYSWTQNLPEKILSGFFIILWGIFINHFGFAIGHADLAIFTYFIGIFTVNILILFLMIIYFKKTRFLDTKQAYRFRLLVENSADIMFLYDYKKASFEYVSPGIYALIGVSADQLYELPERFFDKVSTPELYKETLSIFSRPIYKPSDGLLCLDNNTTGEVYRWSEIHYLPITDSTGTVVSVEGILRDITKSKQLEDDLAESEMAKKELLENISHEIKTPVTLIQGYTESLLNKVVPADSSDTYLKMICSKAKMLTNLVDDLAKVTQVTSQNLEYKFYEENALGIFKDLIMQCEFQIAQMGQKPVISYDIPDDIVLVVDPYRIQQVISNLINNSVHHTPEGNEIAVSCHIVANKNGKTDLEKMDPSTIPEGELIFTVSDNGHGIPENELPHIFERRYSGGSHIDPSIEHHPGIRSTFSASPSRSGLGLFISMQIIQQHSGRIWAANNKKGGAEVSFALPFYK